MAPTRVPQRLSSSEFWPIALRAMLRARRLDERMSELFRKGQVKGTVTLGAGTEATAVGMSLPLRPGRDVVSLLHRDIAAHLVLGLTPHKAFCQYMANAASPTHGREGNVHHGDAGARRFPMMSHLGAMLSPVVGGVWAARRAGEDALGLAVIGDGGTSTGSFHEALNMAAVRRVPVLFIVENNNYAFSTPVSEQYACTELSSRAAGYGISGRTIDGTDVWTVYSAVCDALEKMQSSSMPFLLECRCLRLGGHAVYDKGEYITKAEWDDWNSRDPVKLAVASALSAGMTQSQIDAIESEIAKELDNAQGKALAEGRPDPAHPPMVSFAPSNHSRIEPFERQGLTNQQAVTAALDYILAHDQSGYVCGMDIAAYGSAFKTCKGLFDTFGRERVINMPLCESAITGFALGSSQCGARPIVEFQFADFVTEAITQLGLNCGTWYFRTGIPAPLLGRLPCGGGVTLGAFHSGEFDGLLSRFAGLKLLYPVTPQEMFEALVAGYYDPNPCLVLEHKLLYTKAKGDVVFDGDLARVWRARQHAQGSQVTVVATGAMVETALGAARQTGVSADVWNPLVLCPMDAGPMVESVRRTGRLLVVQESSGAFGLADRIVSLVCQQAGDALRGAPVVISAPDTPVPFAPELETRHRPGVQQVAEAMGKLCGVA